MALLVLDSFDHYATADLPAKGWSTNGTFGSTVTIAFSDGLCVLMRDRYSSTNSALDTFLASSAASCSVAGSQAKSSGAKEDTGISFYW